MGNQISQIVSLFLHAGLAGLALFYQPAIQPVQKGDGFLMELSEGPTPKGETLIPPIEKPKKIKLKKIVKPVAKPMPNPVVVQQKESAKVVTQTQESPIKAA
ncbi:MAG: hypothetical protein HRT44_06480, partial [Bdellovibrionales bacterium]|nr:hypothetical protein [Bdellovibrionales bacterium]NQZ18887.1 hypothetical protein [Bdellovibrionales bacterium]